MVTFAFGYFTFGMAFMQVFAPLFAKREDIFDIGDGGFGYMMAVSAIGGTIGALGLAAANPHRRRGILMIGVMGAFGLFLMAFAMSAQINSVILGFVFMFMLGIGQSSFQPLINSVAVELSPDNMRGRVIGVISLDRATIALGGAIAGLLASALNPVAAQALFGLVVRRHGGDILRGLPHPAQDRLAVRYFWEGRKHLADTPLHLAVKVGRHEAHHRHGAARVDVALYLCDDLLRGAVSQPQFRALPWIWPPRRSSETCMSLLLRRLCPGPR